MNNELEKYNGNNQIDTPLSVEQLVGQVNLIQKVMSAVMKENEHFGIIPGCGKKPSLLQPGAQKLLVTFRLAPEYNITEKLLDKGHREYVVQCSLKTIGSGSFVGQGAGSASTMEGKWRFRVAPKKLTDRPVPKAYWDLRQSDPKAAQEAIGGKGFSTQKDDNGQWMIAEGSSDKVEHDNPADYYNTVLKMACKRALVAATLTATAASDIFTQDVEELVENMKAASEPAGEPKQPATPVQTRSVAAPKPVQQYSDKVTPDGHADEVPAQMQDDGEQAIGTIESISYKDGVKNGKTWRKVSIKVNDSWFQSFSDTIAATAEQAKGDAATVRVIYKEVVSGQYTNRNIEFLTILGDA